MLQDARPPINAKQVVDYVRMLRARNAKRDIRHRDISAIRDGDYQAVAPGVFPPEFPQAMVANMIDVAARDTSELMAPMPKLSCSAVTISTDAGKQRAAKRTQIALNNVQSCRLQRSRYEGADRYVTYGFMAYIVEPDFVMGGPTIRVSCVPSSYYVMDYFGHCKMYAEVTRVQPDVLKLLYPQHADVITAQTAGGSGAGSTVPDLEIIRYYDDKFYALILMANNFVLASAENPIGRCPVTVVERPSVTNQVHGQFDDVIWVQIVRAMIANYTLSAVEQSVNAPIVIPTGTQGVELGPLTTLETDNPQGVGRLRLDIPQGVFPEQQILEQQQLTGSRYPTGRTGNIDASIITGQGVQALMGTFDTQIRTFQTLDQVALQDAMSMMFEMDEKVWGDVPKTAMIQESGSPTEVKYTPSKDIAGDYTINVSYGAVAGLDPNRGLVLLLQGVGAGLLSRETAQEHLPVDINPLDEQRKMNVEAIRNALTGAVATLPQAIPQMAASGGDAREMVLQINDVLKRLQKNESIESAIEAAFVSKIPQPPETPGAPPAVAPGGPAAPTTPGQQLMQLLAGTSPGGSPSLSASVRRTQPVQ